MSLNKRKSDPSGSLFAFLTLDLTHRLTHPAHIPHTAGAQESLLMSKTYGTRVRIPYLHLRPEGFVWRRRLPRHLIKIQPAIGNDAHAFTDNPNIRLPAVAS